MNEVYLRLVEVKNIDWQQRAHFFALSVELMRRILVDSARSRGADKRGGGAAKINLDDSPVLSPEPDRLILALDEALQTLAKLASRQARVVKLRYLDGLSERRPSA